ETKHNIVYSRAYRFNTENLEQHNTPHNKHKILIYIYVHYWIQRITMQVRRQGRRPMNPAEGREIVMDAVAPRRPLTKHTALTLSTRSANSANKTSTHNQGGGDDKIFIHCERFPSTLLISTVSLLLLFLFFSLSLNIFFTNLYLDFSI
ncbi:hypothetical protein L9F63_008129, partial [Diploptera punctata]